MKQKAIVHMVVLKAYSVISNRGRSENCQSFNFLHIFELSSNKHNGIRLKLFQYEMGAIFTESLVHETFFNIVVYGSNKMHIIMHKVKNVQLELTEILEISFFGLYLLIHIIK